MDMLDSLCVTNTNVDNMKIEGQFVVISVVRQRHSLVSRSFESGHLCKSDTHLNKVENGPQLIEQLAQDSEGLQKLLQGYIIAIFRLLSQSSKDLCQLSPGECVRHDVFVWIVESCSKCGCRR